MDVVQIGRTSPKTKSRRVTIYELTYVKFAERRSYLLVSDDEPQQRSPRDLSISLS